MTFYKISKIRILKHFGIHISSSEMKHLSELKSEISVDQWGRSLILKHLERCD